MTSGVLAGAVAATLFLVVAELLGGYVGHSISLVSDALHNLSDIPTLLISWIAVHWAARPADHERTYGYQRAGVLAAFTNAILLTWCRSVFSMRRSNASFIPSPSTRAG